ncbi:MAG: glycoside hydrolase family 15 protein, partial [Solirubrobacteraceae bacterium]
ALVSRDGSIDWWCQPRYDGPSVFGRLLDPDAGHWSIRPVGRFTSRRRYAPGSLVCETTFTTDAGVVVVRDALAFPEGQRGHDLGLNVEHELLRSVVGVRGRVELVMELAPRPEYGLVEPLMRQTDDGPSRAHPGASPRVGSWGARTFGGPNAVALRAGVPAEVEGATVRARFALEPGETAGFSLGWAPPELPVSQPTAPEHVAGRLADLAETWASWEAEHDIYDGAHREAVRLSARVLKGLSYRPTGAIVAAATTSLPESVGGGRNWDYRYAWIRDASLTMEALYIGACPDEATDFVSFMTANAGGGHGLGHSLQIMYGVGGEHDLSERELGHLRGWRDSRPVRVGNGAWAQVQNDVYGELLNALHLYRERLGHLHPEIQHFVAELADAAAARWREPDSGMWEMRGEPRHHLSSKVLCWVALDRAVDLAPQLGSYAKPQAWAAERDRVRAAVLDRGWSERAQAYAQSFDSDELDAAQLLMPMVGFLAADDPRMRSTIEAIARELTEDGLVLRYRGSDGLEGGEGTFVICSYWMVCALARAGELERARVLFDRLAGYADDLGLRAEEIDAATGEQLGNTPQAFSHVGLIVAARELDVAAQSAVGQGAEREA